MCFSKLIFSAKLAPVCTELLTVNYSADYWFDKIAQRLFDDFKY